MIFRWTPLLLMVCSLHGQTGQEGPRREWPCVAGHAVDPAYLETSESTGGQIFLFQKSEIGQASLFMAADYTHPATVARAVGTLSGMHEFGFPVDSTIRSLLVLVSIQCRASIGVFRPGGAEMTAANSTQSVDLQAGRGLKIDNPEPGPWKLRLEGTGLFVVSVRAQSPLQLRAVEFLTETGPDAAGSSAIQRQPRLGAAQESRVHLAGAVSSPEFQLVDAAGDPISRGENTELVDGDHRFSITPSIERFRIRLTGTDPSGWPIQRVHPVLFRAQPIK